MHNFFLFFNYTVADPGGAEGAMAPPGPVKIGHKKDGHRRRPHRFHVSRPPLPGRWIRYCYMNRVAKYPGNLAGNVQREVGVLLSNIMQLRTTLSFSFTGLLSFCTAPMQIDFMYFRTRSLSLCIARHTS